MDIRIARANRRMAISKRMQAEAQIRIEQRKIEKLDASIAMLNDVIASYEDDVAPDVHKDEADEDGMTKADYKAIINEMRTEQGLPLLP